MPNLGLNIISVSSSSKIFNHITIGRYHYLISKKNNCILAQAEEIGGLYYLPIINNTITKPSDSKETILNIRTNILSFYTLYQRFAHVNYQNLDNILKNTQTEFKYHPIIQEDKPCEVYLQANFKNKRYKKSSNTYIYNYLDKISSDLCSPIKEATYDKYRYFITFLDKGTRYLEVQLLRNKKEVFKTFLAFKARSENNISNKRIRIFQTDNGTEYTNKQFEEYLIKEGIIHQLSPPYTKESNGFPKRINQTLLGKIRALLINSGAPKYLWGEALNAIVYIYNRTPYLALNFITLYKKKNN